MASYNVVKVTYRQSSYTAITLVTVFIYVSYNDWAMVYGVFANGVLL